ncbi:MAG TPA: hypothetical protein VI795_00375 [Patescibacteria group bacterium]|nr:hypothetical protein [Patescibacteria group bacterium]
MNPFGSITVPAGLQNFGTDPAVAIGKLIQFALRGLIVVAGIYALFNLVLAGFSFLSAGDDTKKVASAWAQIYQTIIGLAVAAGSFVLAAIFGELLFNNWLFLLQPTIPLP